MIFQDKIQQISDSIHGSIQISEIEKQIISTQVFNRLHHVLQNSTAYLTFPSNTTSRFAHSIGTMHLGGEIFKYGITNATNENTEEFFEMIKEYLEEIISKYEFQQDLKFIFNERGSSDYNRIIEQLFKIEVYEPFYISSIPALIPKKDFYYYIVTFQSIRCAALLHDLGHPPFSHITESALDNIYIHINEKKKKGQELTKREENFYKIINFYKTKNDQLHEQLGKKLCGHIFDVLIKDVTLEEEDYTYCKKVFYLHIKHMTLSILNDENDHFRTIHEIISGPIDCDRLDYVSRDPYASGFNDGIIEYERLTKSMKLVKDNNRFMIIPSAQTMNTIEDFFQRRWKMYKYIIMHHRVGKTDTLLREAVESLAKDYLSKNDEDSKIEGYKIPNDISGLWKMVDNRVNITNSDYINHLIQWDDAWLISCLRQEYFSLQSNNAISANSFLIIKLEELLSNKKKYDSLYKRYDGFIELDTYILEAFDTSWLEPLKQNEHVVHLIELIKFFKNNDLQSRKEGYSFLGLFTYILYELVDSFSKVEFDSIVESALAEVAKEFKVDDTIFKRNHLKTGLDKESVYVYSGSNVYNMEKYSNIKAELTANKKVFPPFYIYLYSNNGPICMSNFKQSLGKKIAIKIKDVLYSDH